VSQNPAFARISNFDGIRTQLLNRGVRRVFRKKQELFFSHLLCSGANNAAKKWVKMTKKAFLASHFCDKSDLEEAGSNTSRFALHNQKRKKKRKLSSLFSNLKYG